jgi:ADP-heptose:LPS heptosyltransferase/O-antigen ligase
MTSQTEEDSPALWWRAVLVGALACYGFFAGFSTAGMSIALVVLFALSLLRPRAVWGAVPWRNPVIMAGLALFAWITAHTLVTTGFTVDARRVINPYHELLLLPLMVALLREGRHRRVFFRALIAGAVALALGYWTLRGVPSLAADFNSRRISASFVLSVVGFAALLQARQSERPWAWRALAAFLALTVLFAMDARTGHLLLVVLATVAAWLHAPGRWRWVALLVVPLLLVAVALSSTQVRSRVAETFEEPPVMAPGDPTSTGIRRVLAELALDLSRKYAVTGAGYANYSKVHLEAARERYGNDPARAHYLDWWWLNRAPNPHNEYAMQLVGGGIVALLLFVGWLGVTVREGLRTPSPGGPMLASAALAFAIGCIFNSMLMDFVEGHFYMGMLALLLAQRRWPEPNPDEQPVRRVLMVATRQIGDVLLTTPLVHAARERWPQAHIDVLGFQGSLGMLTGNADVNSMIEAPQRLGAGGTLRWAPRLWRRWDLALIADAGDRAHLLGWLAAPRRSGIVPERSGSNWWKRPLLQHVVTAAGDRGSVHSLVEKHALLAPWLPAGASPVAPVVPSAAPLPADLQAALEPGCVLVHAPSMWDYKQWPIAHYEAVVRELLAQGRQVVLTGSGSARDQECIGPLRQLAASPRLLDTSGRLDFNQLVSLFHAAALYIGPDTSVSHLAAAAGLPVIAVFGPTNPLRWAPWPGRSEQPVQFVRRADTQQTGNVTILQGAQQCVPCGRAGCEDHRESRSDCLSSILPELVLAQVRRVLSAPDAGLPQHGTGGARHA